MSENRDGESTDTPNSLAAALSGIFDSTTDTTMQRLLVPVDATPRSRWGVKYAVWKHRTGRPVEVSLLHVAEPLLRRSDILRFRSEQQVAQLRAHHARWLLEDAATRLRSNGIAHQLYFREGEVVFEILNAAEQLGCGQIVVPAPPPGWRRIFRGRVVAQLRGNRSGATVITVNEHGLPKSK